MLKKKANTIPQIFPSEAGKGHILAVPPNTSAAVTAGVCFAWSVGSEERCGRREMSWCGVTDEWVEERGRGKHYCNTVWTVRDPCTPTHVHSPTHIHAHLNLGACKHTHADAHYTQTVFEGRFNHGDTHLRAVLAAWRWLWPSLDARRDEQSEH